jgi:iduronate 2-sulfatase
MTGLRPDSTRVWDLKTKFRETIPSVVTLPQYFAQNGYRTSSIGKIYHNDVVDTPSWSEPQIFDKEFPFDADAVYLHQENLLPLEEKKENSCQW